MAKGQHVLAAAAAALVAALCLHGSAAAVLSQMLS